MAQPIGSHFLTKCIDNLLAAAYKMLQKPVEAYLASIFLCKSIDPIKSLNIYIEICQTGPKKKL